MRGNASSRYGETQAWKEYCRIMDEADATAARERTLRERAEKLRSMWMWPDA